MANMKSQYPSHIHMRTSLQLILMLVLSINCYAQKSSICAVKYKDLSTNLGTYHYWFYPDKLIGINEINYKAHFSNGFPVLIDGVMRTETDTVKYKKEYEAFIADVQKQLSKSRPNVKRKYYQSDILFTSITVADISKDFIVIDSLQQMNGWQMTTERTLFMGFTCQKASIQYKGQEYAAWFAPDLPYNAGPGDFRGLPGLILKVANTNNPNQGFEAIEILTPYKGEIPAFYEKGSVVSRKEWTTFINEFNRKAREARKNQLEQERKANGN